MNPAPSPSPVVIDLARYRTATRRCVLRTLTIPSPPGFAFLGLPDADTLPAFMKPGLAGAGAHDV